jgi:hypothetical protein
MDPQRLKDTYEKLRSLDDRLTHKVRPRSGGPLIRPGTEHLEQAVRELAAYTVELKEIVDDLIQAIAARPKPPGEG